jgi:hypothetical protein
MKHIISTVYNIDSKLYDVVVTTEKYSCVLEVICSCKSFDNAQWIVDLINKERGI